MAQLKLDLPGTITEEEARLYLAMKLYELGKVSLGKAAQIAGLPKKEFMEILGKHGIPIFNYSPEDLDREMKVWEKL